MSQEQRFETFSLIDPFSLAKADANYEFLRGGNGRSIYYRQHRYRVDLLKEVQHLGPRVVSEVVEGDLVDFAITGVSCLCEGIVDVEPETPVNKLWVMIDDLPYYTGRAQVTHVSHLKVDNNGGGEQTLVGIKLLDDVLDIDKVLSLRVTAEMHNEMKGTRVTLNRADISPLYKAAVSDFLFLLLRYRSLLNSYERNLMDSGSDVPMDAEAEILAKTWEPFSKTLFEIQARLDDLTKDQYYDRDFQELYRAYTLPILTPHVASSPFSRRAWLKPLGYPGDYMLMCYLYDDLWEGNTLFEKLMHQYPMRHQMSDAVRNRKGLIQKYVYQAIEKCTKPAGEPVRVLGLASGPAREVEEFVEQYTGDRPVEFTLIDQDNRALSYANRRISPVVVKSSGPVKVQFLYVALRQLIEDQKLFSTITECDLAYTAGLFDYLSTGKGKLLMSKLYEKVSPGGDILVGNYAGRPPEFAWLPTYVYDWPLRYRSRVEMSDLADGLDGVEQVQVLTEATNAQYFTHVSKRKK